MRGNTHRSAERNGRVLRNGSSHNPARRIMAALVSVALSFTLAGATVAAYGNEGTTEETQQSPATAEPIEGAPQPEQNEDQGQATPEVQQTPEPSTPEPAETSNVPSESQETPQPDDEPAQENGVAVDAQEVSGGDVHSNDAASGIGQSGADKAAKQIDSDIASAAPTGARSYAAENRAADSTNPTILKTIAKRPNTDNGYTLDLSITGGQKIDVDRKADVVFVVDTSSSMGRYLYPPNSNIPDSEVGITVAKNAITGLLSLLQTNEPEGNVRAALVNFSNTATIDQQFTSNLSNVQNKVNGLTTGGFTNWDDGFRKANEVLTRARTGARKYVVFITDGEPTKTGANGTGDGYNHQYIGNAITEAKKRGDAYLYVIRAPYYQTDHPKQDLITWTQELATGANAVGQKTFDGQSARDMKEVMDVIYDSLTDSTRTRARVITDTLSQWVEPDGWNASNITDHIRVYKKDAHGTETVVNRDAYTASLTGKTITVTFKGNGFEAVKPVAYGIRFNVRPTSEAYAQWMKNNDDGRSGDSLYLQDDSSLNRGAVTTGDTSANKAGFFSNANAEAKFRDCTTSTTPSTKPGQVQVQTTTCTTDLTREYKKPVVQVKVKNAFTSIPVTKVVEGTPGWRSGDSFTFTLTAKNGAPMPQQNTVTIGKAGSSNTATGKFGEITYNKTGTYTYEVTETGGTGLYTYSKAKYTVAVTVTSNPDVNNPRYEVSSVAITKNQNDDGSGASGTVQSAVFTNKNATVTVGGFAVQKNLVGRDWNNSDSFTFELNRGSGSSSAPLPAGCQKTPCSVSINHDSVNKQATFGNFTFTEPGTYQYTVSEQKGNITSIMYSQATYAVTVVVSRIDNPSQAATLQATVTAQRTQNDDGNAPASATTVTGALPFTNTWITVSKLPLTGEGGATPLLWLVAAGGLGAFALLILGGGAIGRKRQTL